MTILTDPNDIKAFEDLCDAQGPQDWALWHEEPSSWVWGRCLPGKAVEQAPKGMTFVASFRGTWREAREHFDALMKTWDVDSFLGSLDDTEFKTWAIWRGNPPDPYSMWSLKPYKGQECDGMRLVAVFGGTARSANRFFLAWTKE